MTLTKADIVPKVAENCGFMRNETSEIIEKLLEIMKSRLIAGEEVMNRVTISGAVEIGRLPGVVTVTMLVPMTKLAELGLAQLVKERYGM